MRRRFKQQLSLVITGDPKDSDNFVSGEFSRYDEHSFSAAMVNMPFNLVRVFVMKDSVSYVYKDGKVDMKSNANLSEEEREYIAELRAHMHSNRVFRQNMDSFGRMMQGSSGELLDGMSRMGVDLGERMSLLGSNLSRIGQQFPTNEQTDVYRLRGHRIQAQDQRPQVIIINSRDPVGGEPFGGQSSVLIEEITSDTNEGRSQRSIITSQPGPSGGSGVESGRQ